jgi:HEAT repeat protein
MLQLVEELKGAGFMQAGAPRPPAGLPLLRTLELVVDGARSQVAAPLREQPEFDALVRLVERRADAELWQLLRHPTDEPERGAFWRAERRFRAAQTDPLAAQRRSVQRAIKVWPLAAPVQRRMILAWVLELPRRGELIREEDGRALLAIVAAAPELQEEQVVLLELAAAAPGDAVWRDCIELATRAPGGGRTVVDRLFQVLGADRVLQALADDRPAVRRAAVDEVVEMRDLRATDRLVQMFDDPDFAVRRAAVYASGQLRLQPARAPLTARIAAADTDPVLRRDALVALGRIGGEGAFLVLQRALAAPVADDRDAALRGLGELKDPRAAAQLASIFAASFGTATGELARSYLQRMGSALAVPALREQLAVGHEAVRAEIVLMLGAYQDPQVVPDLVELLHRRREPLLVAGLLAGTTGLDLDTVADPVLALNEWYRDHRLEPQWRWLLQALERDKVPHALDPAQFAPGAGLLPVPELVRLLLDGETGRLRVLTAAVLRTHTGEDYGQITPATPPEVRRTIAARYRDLYESARAARGR